MQVRTDENFLKSGMLSGLTFALSGTETSCSKTKKCGLCVQKIVDGENLVFFFNGLWGSCQKSKGQDQGFLIFLLLCCYLFQFYTLQEYRLCLTGRRPRVAATTLNCWRLLSLPSARNHLHPPALFFQMSVDPYMGRGNGTVAKPLLYVQ